MHRCLDIERENVVYGQGVAKYSSLDLDLHLSPTPVADHPELDNPDNFLQIDNVVLSRQSLVPLSLLTIGTSL